jgi:hypothetical protein
VAAQTSRWNANGDQPRCANQPSMSVGSAGTVAGAAGPIRADARRVATAASSPASGEPVAGLRRGIGRGRGKAGMA